MSRSSHAAASYDCGMKLISIDAQALEGGGAEVEALLHDFTGIVVPGGFGERGIEGKIQAAGYARTHAIPYLGLCLGMQVATIEFARNACGMEHANSTEFDLETPFPGDFPVGTAAQGGCEGRVDAPGRLADAPGSRHAGREGLRTRRNPGTPPASLRVQQRLSRAS